MKFKYCCIKGFEPRSLRYQNPCVGLYQMFPSPSITPRQKSRLFSRPITLQVSDFFLTIPYFIRSLISLSDLTVNLHAPRFLAHGGWRILCSDFKKVFNFFKWFLSFSRSSICNVFSLAIQPSAMRNPIQYADSGVIVANAFSLNRNCLEASDLFRISTLFRLRTLIIVVRLTLKRTPILVLGIPFLYSLIIFDISFLSLILFSLFIGQLYYSKHKVVKGFFPIWRAF